ncbi:MAG TPA: hypothetical protein VGG73_01355 [Vicinamibacterales bacterium]|jgi:hypothetical protein
MTRRWLVVLVALVLLLSAASLAYLYDPPWIVDVTSGLRAWEEDPPGTRFRWTTGRGTFFIPSSSTEMILPLRAVFPGPNGTAVNVEVRGDGKLVGTIALTNPDEWVRARLSLRPSTSRRRYRRIDLGVSRVVPPFTLGVMTGVVDAR